MAYKPVFDGNTDRTVTLGKEGNPKSIEGYFLGTKEVSSDYGVGKLHIFQTGEGTIGVWGKSRLDKMLNTSLVGQMCLVQFTGMIASNKKGRKPSYGFKVMHDPENVIEVHSSPTVSSEALDESTDEELIDSYESVEELEEAVPYTPPAAPKRPAVAANPAKQAAVQALLNGNKSRLA